MTLKKWMRSKGSALLIVLASVVLLTVLVLVFFGIATSETTSSQLYSAGVNSEKLADMAAQIVQAQITAATAPPNNQPGNTTQTWTSQPGLLRTFDSTGGSGLQVFKLYSAAPNLTEKASEYGESEDAPPTHWRTDPNNAGLWVDLNAPSFNAAGVLCYPIAAPFPVTVPPTAPLGYTYASAPDYTASANNVNDGPTNNQIPMPVKWLYVLADGQLAVPASGSNGKITFSNSVGALPSSSNRIVGRIAYWTDDETCKVNLNTASFGSNQDTSSGAPFNYWTYWDTPYTLSQQEKTYLSLNQPSTGEYQRYPGHPATTALNDALPSGLVPTDIFSIAPRTKSGGSLGGTSNPALNGNGAVASKGDRLYASLDELFFTPSRGKSSSISATTSTLTNQTIDSLRFLATSYNRAPELNAFGQPRVTIWPEPEAAGAIMDHRTSLDKLIAFCSTLYTGTPAVAENFYFQRHDPTSQNELGGIGGNASLYLYLQRLTSKAVPGSGGPSAGFADASQFGIDRDQILTAFFDTIRIGNLAENTAGAVPYTGPNAAIPGPTGFVVPTVYTATDSPNNVATRGAGRTYIIKEAGAVFAPNDSTAKTCFLGLLFQYFLPTSGPVAITHQDNTHLSFLSLQVSGLLTLKVNGSSVFTSDTYSQNLHGQNLCFDDSGIDAWGAETCGPNGWAKTTGVLPPTSGSFPITGTAFNFNGGTIKVQLYSNVGATSVLLQTYNLVFPPQLNLPAPFWIADPTTYPTWAVDPGVPVVTYRFNTYTTSYVYWTDTVRSLTLLNGDFRPLAYLATPTDGNLTANYPFAPRAGYTNTSLHRVHSLSASGGNEFNGTTETNFTSEGTPTGKGIWHNGLPIGNSSEATTIPPIDPSLPPPNWPLSAVDWDSGIGLLPDGGYLPKPDEGFPYVSNGTSGSPGAGYFDTGANPTPATMFAPNRQFPSAVIFGDTPRGVLRGTNPWQTLLFRPDHSYPPFGTSTHPGAVGLAGLLPDHLLLDLFTMPIVQPYAISEPFSTAGKVNMNYQIVPFFSYLGRDTAMRAVLDSVRLAAVPNTFITANNATNARDASAPVGTGSTRYPLDDTQTLTQFVMRFNQPTGPKVFITPSEICTLDLVPQGGYTTSTLSAFWADKLATGGNLLQRPYALIYPRLTTKSNTFTVHIFAQSLQPVGSDYTTWTEGKDQVTGQWRGSEAIERYLDPADPTLPNFLTSDISAESYYHFRSEGLRRFAP